MDRWITPTRGADSNCYKRKGKPMILDGFKNPLKYLKHTSFELSPDFQETLNVTEQVFEMYNYLNLQIFIHSNCYVRCGTANSQRLII